MKTVIRNSYTPQIGDYCETIVVDRESGFKYLFDCDGVYTRSSIGEIIEDLDGYREAHRGTDVFSTGGTLDAIDYYVGEEAAAREAADEEIEQEIEDLRNNTDVVDIVGTHAELEGYDTSSLGDNDIIKVLQDETRDNATTYYKWHIASQTWEYIGEQGPFYTQAQTDDLLDGKQDTLTAGDNITIDADNVISATVPEVDSALSFTSTNAVENQAIKNAIYAKRSGNYDNEIGVDIKYDNPYSSPYVAIGGVATGGRGSASVGIGYDSSAAGLGSVAIGDGAATTNREQVAIGMLTKGGPYSTVIGARSRADTSTGSYNVLIGPSSRIDGGSANSVLIGRSVSVANGASNSVAVGYDASIGTAAENGIAIGNGAEVAISAVGGIAIGHSAEAGYQGSVAIGSGATTSAGMTVSVGNSVTKRRITWLADGINGFDAVNKSQLDTAIAGVTVPVMTGATASTAGAQGSAPAPAAGDQDKFLKGDGTWASWVTYSDFTGATSSAAGVHGLVPAPAAGDQDKYLKGDGTWNEVQIPPTRAVLYMQDRPASLAGVAFNIYKDEQFAEAITWAEMFELLNAETGRDVIIRVGNGADDVYSVVSFLHESNDFGVVDANNTNGIAAIYRFSGDPNDVLQTRSKFLVEEQGIGGLTELSYGNSTWNDFITAYRAGKIVYCRASSNANPATGSQGRKAFMAYVNNADNPTEVEFQYVRSVSTKTASQPVDQVFVYKLTSAGVWTVETRDMGPKLAAGTNTSVSYSNGTYTVSATDTTYSAFTGATSGADGAAGLVPKPLIADRAKYLKGDGTWDTITVPVLYTTTGQNVDGAVTQKLFTDTVGNVETILNTLNVGNGAQ